MTELLRQEILNQFEQNHQAMLAMLKTIQIHRFTDRPTEESWSIAEIVEHVILVETGIINNLKKLGAKAAVVTFEHPPSNHKVREESASRTVRATAPTVFEPKGTFTSSSETIAAFTNHRQSIEQFVQQTSLNLKAINFPHPRLGMYNGENWLTFIVGHCERHIQQIAQTKL